MKTDNNYIIENCIVDKCVVDINVQEKKIQEGHERNKYKFYLCVFILSLISFIIIMLGIMCKNGSNGFETDNKLGNVLISIGSIIIGIIFISGCIITFLIKLFEYITKY